MTTDITELAQSLKASAKKATKGQWVAFTDTATRTFSVHTPDDARCENIIKWAGFDCQKNAKSNAEFIALANPANVLALVEALEKGERANGYLREQSAEWERKAISNFEDCAEMSARIEELESQRKLAFAASNRWADKFRESEKRIAELESRTVIVKLPKPHAHLIWIQAGHAPDDYWDDVAVSHSEKDHCCDGSERYPVYARWEIEEMLTGAGIKVEAE
ncbi:ead/Ea22-like family protein [Klebsiella michiganensis]|jgi:hypothetical protein|uniref:ead/Ea22-like family protein n=1 Tax=Klebsiella michiganensis TaxID=1134687 RepID=UPI001FFC48D5|nr:ead/Ea22-like family protein [Klebsiella michiganensis]MCK2101904.1 ead/Ea22-like family protein [Klebsiella michiganensis]MDQ4327715.1 ead/Ea22-like family protein [Klebsiella michiganensis]